MVHWREKFNIQCTALCEVGDRERTLPHSLQPPVIPRSPSSPPVPDRDCSERQRGSGFLDVLCMETTGCLNEGGGLS
ncbi:hypothetical protein ABG768_015867, partial [Culter alburnus]